MTDKDTLTGLASMLDVKPKVLEADIKELAWLWEESIEVATLPALVVVLDTLHSIAKAYLRGRNVRMGNLQGQWRHLGKKASVVKLVLKYVCSNDENPYHFPKLHKAGITSSSDFLHGLREDGLTVADVETYLERQK